jgi:hypothetical protein
MNDPDSFAQQEAAYQRLWELREELDETDMLRPRRFGLRLHALAEEAQTADESAERMQSAVDAARQVGLGWDRIGEALGMSDREAVYEFGEPDL